MRVSTQVQYCLGIWNGIWGASLGTKEQSRGRWEPWNQEGPGKGLRTGPGEAKRLMRVLRAL